LVRYKKKLTEQISSEKNRIIKILEDANIKLSSVLSDIFGVTGTKIINEIISGEYKPENLLYHVHGKVQKSRAEIKEAITGNVTPHHRFMLQTIMENIQKIEGTIAKLDEQIAKQTEEYNVEIELLDSIPGVDKEGAICIIAEIGTDMDAFPDQKHLAKWAGMCPGNNESGGKKKSGRIPYGNAFLRAFLVEMAWAATRTKHTYFSNKYKSLVGRKGKKKALIAVGHKILIAAYFILKNKVFFNELGENYLSNFRKDKLIEYYRKQLALLETNTKNFENQIA
jgi:transposase